MKISSVKVATVNFFHVILSPQSYTLHNVAKAANLVCSALAAVQTERTYIHRTGKLGKYGDFKKLVADDHVLISNWAHEGKVLYSDENERFSSVIICKENE